jgi:hypothetical protein
MYPHAALPSDPLQRLPELLGRLPLPSEVWPRLPEPVRRAAALWQRVPPFPHLTGPQVFAAVVPAGLVLGWLASFAVNPDIIQRGGAPYIERLEDGVRVELSQPAYAYDGYPVDPAPFGYGNAPRAELLSASIADVGQYADDAEGDAEGAAPEPAVVEGAVPDNDTSPVIAVVRQDTPIAATN